MTRSGPSKLRWKAKRNSETTRKAPPIGTGKPILITNSRASRRTNDVSLAAADREFLALLGTFHANVVYGVLGTLVVIPAAWYLLYL